MARKQGCAWCISTSASHWDGLLADGMPLAAVSAITGFSEAVGLSHAKHHLPARNIESALPGSEATAHEVAVRLLRIASLTAARSDVAEESGSVDLMFRAVESRAAAAAALATIFHLSNLQADDLLAECEAFIRAVHRLSSSGLPAEVETLAWLVREAGGHEVAAAMELTYRKDPR